MKLMIDIPDKIYETVQNGTYCGTLYEELKNGTPLSELEDCISRQAAIDTYKNLRLPIYPLEELPSVKPEQKVGRWIEREDAFGDTFYNCSACGEMWSTIDGNPWDNGMDYCPNCGAKMQASPTGEEVQNDD